MSTRPAQPELLAPAGDWESLRAAVANGADAVYFGLEAFNARHRATNFTRAELPAVVDYLHDRNTRGYVALNTLVFPDEWSPAADYVQAIAESGADAVIVQDLGLVQLIRQMTPTLPIHASTQMTQTEAGGLALLRDLGVARVILARELTLAELGQLVPAAPLPVEVFVHGALCISYSGQCLASATLWGRSANRGECGQACRLPYQLVIDGRNHHSGDRKYPLSAQDLAACPRIPELVALGVAALKIEGRLKSAHYVAAATRMYRAALDAARSGHPFEPPPGWGDELAQSFSRGFSAGFLNGVDHQGLVHGRFPKKRGVCVGTVVDKTQRSVILALDGVAGGTPLKPGDGVVFDAGHPEQDEQGGRVFTARASGANRVELTFGRGDVNLAAVGAGTRVWKTDDPALRRRLVQSYSRDLIPRRIVVDARVEAVAGGQLSVCLRDATGHNAVVTWDQALAAAQTQPLTLATIRAQLGRLGDSPFQLGRVDLYGPGGPSESEPVMVPKSVLNDLRRRAVQALREQRAAQARHWVADAQACATLRHALVSGSETTAGDSPRLAILARDPRQFAAALAWCPPPSVGVSALYCDFQDFGNYGHAVAAARHAGWPIGLATPYVLMPGEERELDRIAGLAPDVMLVRNLGSLIYLRTKFPTLQLVADASLNVCNELTAAALVQYGLQRLTPSHDLDEHRLTALLQQSPGICFEVVLHEHVPLFHTRHCLFAAALSSGPRCGDCGWRCRSHEIQLRDRNGVLHLVWPDGFGRNTVFHGAVRSALDRIPALRAAGVRFFRIELVPQTAAQTRNVLDRCAGALAEPLPGS